MIASLPVSGDLRRARVRASSMLGRHIEPVRGPFLACLGAGELAVATLAEVQAALPGAKLWGVAPRRTVSALAELQTGSVSGAAASAEEEEEESGAAQLRWIYVELTDRGQQALDRIGERPEVARARGTMEKATAEFTRRLEFAVDELNDLGEEALARLGEQVRTLRPGGGADPGDH